jgi:hypothetical protein
MVDGVGCNKNSLGWVVGSGMAGKGVGLTGRVCGTVGFWPPAPQDSRRIL